MENGLKELQQRLVEMLSSFQKFTQQNGMIFFLVGGSALGAVRHQGFIPWDDDVDIAMMREDFEKMEYLMGARTHYGECGGICSVLHKISPVGAFHRIDQ